MPLLRYRDVKEAYTKGRRGIKYNRDVALPLTLEDTKRTGAIYTKAVILETDEMTKKKIHMRIKVDMY